MLSSSKQRSVPKAHPILCTNCFAIIIRYMTKLTNPFEANGYDPRMMDVAVQSLRRGRNGQGVTVNVVLADSGEIVELKDDHREVISDLVDNVRAPDPVHTVAFGIIAVLCSIERPSHSVLPRATHRDHTQERPIVVDPLRDDMHW